MWRTCRHAALRAQPMSRKSRPSPTEPGHVPCTATGTRSTAGVARHAATRGTGGGGRVPDGGGGRQPVSDWVRVRSWCVVSCVVLVTARQQQELGLGHVGCHCQRHGRTAVAARGGGGTKAGPRLMAKSSDQPSTRHTSCDHAPQVNATTIRPARAQLPK